METNTLGLITYQDFTLTMAQPSDVVEAFFVTRVVVSDYLKHAVIHNDLFSNNYDTLQKCIHNESLYILKMKDVSLGMITFEESVPVEFNDICWFSTGKKCLYISRLYVIPFWRNRGTDKILLRMAEYLAREKGYDSIKIDITSNFDEGNLLLTEQNYRFAGNVFYKNQRTPVNCYEKIIA